MTSVQAVGFLMQQLCIIQNKMKFYFAAFEIILLSLFLYLESFIIYVNTNERPATKTNE